MVLDIEDAFLRVDQPADEKASIRYGMKRYKLKNCLPGLRTAARHWFELFKSTAEEYGMESKCFTAEVADEVRKDLVDSSCRCCSRDRQARRAEQLREVLGKKKLEDGSEWSIWRDIRELAKVVMLQSHHVPKNVPGKNNFNKKMYHRPWNLMRSQRLMHTASERPDAQHCIQGLP